MATATTVSLNRLTATEAVDPSGVVARLQAGLDTLPEGYPARLVSPLAWKGADFKEQSDYVLELNEVDLSELAAALSHFKGLDLDGDQVERANFPLPTLGLKLAGVARALYQGCGFQVIRGINPSDHTAGDLTILNLGIQSHIGRLGRQDNKGNMLVHIVADNNATEKVREHHRHSSKTITFHTEDHADIVGWLTRSCAASGGSCVIAPIYTVYNVLAATRPELLRVLARSDWAFGMPSFHCRPVLFVKDGNVMMNFGRAALMGSASNPRPASLPKLNSRQVEALDAIERIARDAEFEFQTEPGDVHLVNNLAVLHRRNAFTNGPGIDNKRHLVRTILRNASLGPQIPDALAPEWEKTFGDDGPKIFHPDPMPDGYLPLRKCPN